MLECQVSASPQSQRPPGPARLLGDEEADIIVFVRACAEAAAA